MNKSIIIYKIQLPNDVLDMICSFNFYSLDQCIDRTKQKYKNVIDCVKVTMNQIITQLLYFLLLQFVFII
jgi:hypothetical protein